jgi:hypothetical protein
MRWMEIRGLMAGRNLARSVAQDESAGGDGSIGYLFEGGGFWKESP